LWLYFALIDSLIMRYYTVYDVTKESYPYSWILLLSVGTLVVFLVLWRIDKKQGGACSSRHRWIPFAPPFMGVWIVLFILGTYVPFHDMRQSLMQGKYTLVEGTVQDFIPGDSGDHSDEELNCPGFPGDSRM